ncbi:MAG: hypothetical protein WD898_00275 [Candidatus Paceibacterota bacterium]
MAKRKNKKRITKDKKSVKRKQRKNKMPRKKKSKRIKVVRKKNKMKPSTKSKRKNLKAKKVLHKGPVLAGETSLRPRYVLNHDFEFFYELRDLILKSSPAENDGMVQKINKIGRVKLAIISGVFMNKENMDSLVPDLLIVGDDIDRRKFRSFLKSLEAEVGKEIRFAVMDKEEFKYRLAMFDRFIRVLLEGPHEKLINKLGL